MARITGKSRSSNENSGGGSYEIQKVVVTAAKDTKDCSAEVQPENIDNYLKDVQDNHNETMKVISLPWRSIPSLDPLQKTFGTGFARAIGGMTFDEAKAYAGTTLGANAYKAAFASMVASGVLINGLLSAGVWVGSMISPRVLKELFLNNVAVNNMRLLPWEWPLPKKMSREEHRRFRLQLVLIEVIWLFFAAAVVYFWNEIYSPVKAFLMILGYFFSPTTNALENIFMSYESYQKGGLWK